MRLKPRRRNRDPEKRRAWLTFVVVGAGPTGVELAGALGEIANDTLKDDFRAIRPGRSSYSAAGRRSASAVALRRPSYRRKQRSR